MLGQNSSGKRAGPKHAGALANHHGAWPHASVKKQENHGRGGGRDAELVYRELGTSADAAGIRNRSDNWFHRDLDWLSANKTCAESSAASHAKYSLPSKSHRRACELDKNRDNYQEPQRRSGIDRICQISQSAKDQTDDPNNFARVLGGTRDAAGRSKRRDCPLRSYRNPYSGTCGNAEVSGLHWRLLQSNHICILPTSADLFCKIAFYTPQSAVERHQRYRVPYRCSYNNPGQKECRVELVNVQRVVHFLASPQYQKSFCRLSGNSSRGASDVFQTVRPGASVRLGGGTGRIETGCRVGSRTRDLRGMNPARYLFATLLKNGWSVIGRQGRSSITRRGTCGRILNSERFSFQTIQ